MTEQEIIRLIKLHDIGGAVPDDVHGDLLQLFHKHGDAVMYAASQVWIEAWLAWCWENCGEA